MPLPRPVRLAVLGLAGLLLAGLVALAGVSLIKPPHDPTLFPAFDPATARPELERPPTPFDPERQAFYGDLHIHSALSPDAYVFGVRAMPADAYRFAKGATLEHGAGYAIRLSRPLDFAAVTDHSEYLGIVRARGEETTLGKRSLRDRLLNDGRLSLTFAWSSSIRELPPFANRKLGPPAGLEHVPAEAWRTIIDAAEAHNDPGRFTTFIAYEWSSPSTLGGHLHRNVFYGTSRVPEFPFSAVDSQNPRDLWQALDAQRAAGMPVIAVPHNPNLSNGEAFQLADRDGNPLDAAYAEARRRNEPLTEIFQVKGTSETHPVLSTGDEFADFEIDEGLIPGEGSVDLRGGYARAAWRRGLELRQTRGFDPFAFGVIGSSDGHGASSPVEEASFFGKLPMLDGSANIRLGLATFVPREAAPASQWGAAGLAGIWAEENTRESLFAAMRRKETFATSGPRLRIRAFGGFAFQPADLERRDAVRHAYAHGVPMGGTLPTATAGGAPGLLLWAARDPQGANLDRLQVIKLWVDAAGTSFEKVFEVAASDGRVPDAAGRIARLPSTVDVAQATWRNDVGAAELSAYWRDPEFDPQQHAAYHARVIEIETPRWSTYDAARLGVEAPEPRTLQERAVASPIWYRPKQ